MVTFNKKWIDRARAEFHKVYMDTETETGYTGSETAYEGDRLRIYVTSWVYEEQEIFRDNESFILWMKDYQADKMWTLLYE